MVFEEVRHQCCECWLVQCLKFCYTKYYTEVDCGVQCVCPLLSVSIDCHSMAQRSNWKANIVQHISGITSYCSNKYAILLCLLCPGFVAATNWSWEAKYGVGISVSLSQQYEQHCSNLHSLFSHKMTKNDTTSHQLLMDGGRFKWWEENESANMLEKCNCVSDSVKINRVVWQRICL